jgi:uncharacterized protein YutE (UPF0331/DUF86 family)
MSPDRIQEKVVAERARRIEDMLRGIRTLPLGSYEQFVTDPRDRAAADSYLRRALEALMDLGRHLLAKGLGQAATEYKDVPRQLLACGVLDPEAAALMGKLAGYRNRLVHFYDEVTPRKLYHICTEQMGDVAGLADALLAWIRAHPEIVDRSL